MRVFKTANDSLVFPSNRSEGGLETHRDGSESAVERSGISENIGGRYTWHCNRHTFASRLVMVVENKARRHGVIG
jgi:hypothetical protein